jgi:hypothetical protein
MTDILKTIRVHRWIQVVNIRCNVPQFFFYLYMYIWNYFIKLREINRNLKMIKYIFELRAKRSSIFLETF